MTFNTTVTGNGPFVFVWRRNNVLLESQVSTQLVLTNVTLNDLGTYAVEVSGGCGTVTNSAALSLFAKTTATPLANQNRCAGANFDVV